MNPLSARIPHRLVLVACLLGVSAAPLATAQSFSTLEERMSVTQFRAAGLDKLSPEELEALNQWLQQNVASGSRGATASVAASHDRIGLPSVEDKNEVHSRIPGQFTGWSGKTRFTLENGQVWQQVGNDKWAGVNLENPAITIVPALMGSWRLKVEGYNTTTKVKRIQ